MAIVLTGGNRVFNVGIIKLLKQARNSKCISSEITGKKNPPAFLFPVAFGTADFLSSREFKKQKKNKIKSFGKRNRGCKTTEPRAWLQTRATPDAEREI